MQRISRKTAGYVYLYVVIASVAAYLIWTLGAYLDPWSDFFATHATLLRLLTGLIVFAPPLITVGVKYPAREALRIRPFTFAQLMFALGIGICAYISLSTISALMDKLKIALMSPELTNLSGAYFPTHTFGIWPHLFTACLIPAVLQGGVFQGAVLSGFHQTRPLKACLTIGLLYALPQFSLFSFIPAALLGFALCYITLRSDSLIPAVSAGFIYLLMERLSVTAWLYDNVFSPVGFSQNTAAIILAVAFILLSGLLMIKMPARRYEKGALKRTLHSLRRVFPGFFSLSSLQADDALEDSPAEEITDTTAEAQQLSSDAALQEALPEAAPDEALPEVPADIDNQEHDLRGDNPLIAGIFISGVVTLVTLGISLLIALDYIRN